MKHQRIKRSPYPPCSCGNASAFGLFQYTNGRCYGYYPSPSQNYSDSQIQCQTYAESGNVGRLATFDSGTDYANIIGIDGIAGPPYAGNAGSNTAVWIGLSNQLWVDPNTPSCPPPLPNAAQFEADAGLTVSIPAGTNTLIDTSWTSWYNGLGTNLQTQLCEIGKTLRQELHFRYVRRNSIRSFLWSLTTKLN